MCLTKLIIGYTGSSGPHRNITSVNSATLVLSNLIGYSKILINQNALYKHSVILCETFSLWVSEATALQQLCTTTTVPFDEIL